MNHFLKSHRIPAVAAALALAAAGCSESAMQPLDQTPGAEDPKEQNNAAGPGDYAADFLTDGTFTELLVEIDYVEGYPPSASAMTELEDVLVELCRKPAGVTVMMDDAIPAAGSPERSVAAIAALEQQYRDHYRDPATKIAVLYCIYLDGNYDQDSGGGRVLGVAYRGSSCAMFQESIEAVDPGTPLFAEIEDTVLVHEAGHLLGLVNNGTPMVNPHQDTAHGSHDTNSDCIMYWLVETQNVVDVLVNGKPDFDAACRADMIAAGGRSS